MLNSSLQVGAFMRYTIVLVMDTVGMGLHLFLIVKQTHCCAVIFFHWTEFLIRLTLPFYISSDSSPVLYAFRICSHATMKCFPILSLLLLYTTAVTAQGLLGDAIEGLDSLSLPGNIL